MKRIALIAALLLPGAAMAQAEASNETRNLAIIDVDQDTGALIVADKDAREWMLYTSVEKNRAIAANYAPQLLTGDVCLKLAKAFMSVPEDRIAHCMNAVTSEFIDVEREADQ